MIFTASFPNRSVRAADALGDMDISNVVNPSLPVADWPPEMRGQFDAAVNAAVMIIDSGAAGNGPFNVSIGGHVPSPGSIGDCINVNVSDMGPG